MDEGPIRSALHQEAVRRRRGPLCARPCTSCNEVFARVLTRAHEGLTAIHQSPVTVPLVVTVGPVYPHLRQDCSLADMPSVLENKVAIDH